MVQNKTQIASNTHRYKKIAKNIPMKLKLYIQAYRSENVTWNIFDKK